MLKFKIISDNFFDLLQASIFWEYLQLQAKVIIIIKHTKDLSKPLSYVCLRACGRRLRGPKSKKRALTKAEEWK